MDAVRWERVQSLFHAVLTLPPPERQAYLESATADDPELITDVFALIEADAAVSGSLLDHGIAHAARVVFDEPGAAPAAIGPYRILRRLGEGGMGVVFLAEREEIGGQVAIKVLRDAGLSSIRRARFEREEQTLARLNHPAIARLFDANVLPDGTPYFVMEYVEGTPLTDYCAQNGCSLEERLHLFRGVCEAVQYAHRQAVVHRDIKPSNILVTRHEPDAPPAVKLLDFGIAKSIESLDTPADQTRTVLRVMTPAYAAPEQVLGEPVGVYTDVYSLGVVLYELLTGTHPLDLKGQAAVQVEARILEHEPERPSLRVRNAGSAARAVATSAGRQAWADLDVLCLTAMHKDPQRRYATVEALLRDLAHYLDGEPLEARRDSWRYRTGKFLRRNRRPVAAAAVVGAVIVGLTAFYTVRLSAARDTAESEAATAEQVSDFLIGLFRANNPFASESDTLDVRTLLRRGVERAEELESQPAVQARMFDVLGEVHRLLSEYPQAESLLSRALSIRRGLGEPLAVARTLHELGALYDEMGDHDRGEQLLREALEIRQRHLPSPHLDLATTLDGVGVVLNKKGQHEEAAELYRRALQMRRELHDGPHIDVASSLNNLAVNRADFGDYEAAERYLREAIAMDSVVLGADNGSTAIDLSNLGVVLQIRGKYAAADSVLTEAMEIKRAALGEDHYETAFSLTQLGGLLREKGDYARAERHLREALAIESRIFEPGHRNTGITLNHLAMVLQGKRQYEGADSLLQRSSAILRANMGDDHPLSAITRCQIAYLRHLQGRDAEAEPQFRGCLADLESALPADHDILASHRGKFGELLVAQSRFAEAESILTDSYDQLEARFGTHHPVTRIAAERLVDLYEASSQPDRAGVYRAVLTALPEDARRQ